MVTRAHGLMIFVTCLASTACVQTPTAPTSSKQAGDMDAGVDMLEPADQGVDMGHDLGLDMNPPRDMTDPPVDMEIKPDFERDMRDAKCEEGAFDSCDDPFTEFVCDASGNIISRTCNLARERCSWDADGCSSLEFSCLLNSETGCQERDEVSADMFVFPDGAVGKLGHALARADGIDEIFVGAPDPKFFFANGDCSMDDVSAPKVLHFSRGDKGWALKNTLDGASGGELGSDIAVSDDGSVLVVAAIKERIDEQSGVVHTYKRDGETYSEITGMRLTSGVDNVVGFGYRIALSPDGTTLLVSHPDARNKKGVVNVYRSSRVEWCLAGTIAAEANPASAFFGSSLAVNWTNAQSPHVVIGAPDRNESVAYDGAAFHTTLNIAQLDCQNPTEVQASRLSVDVTSAQVGLDVAISPSGKTIAVGTPTLKGGVVQGGAVIFRAEPTGVVREQVVYGQLSSAELAGGTAGFGGKLVLPSDDYLIMGGSVSSGNAPSKTAWSAHVLHGNSSTLMQKHITSGVGASQGEFHVYTRTLQDGSSRELRLLWGQSILEYDFAQVRADDPMCTMVTPSLGAFYDEILVTAPDYALFAP